MEHISFNLAQNLPAYKCYQGIVQAYSNGGQALPGAAYLKFSVIWDTF